MSTTSTVTQTTAPKVTFNPRRSADRGHADLGWLQTYHTFSFSSYSDPRHAEYGALRVVNEDRVRKATGFGAHPHREFEIFSYVVEGELVHQDSLHNKEVLRRGDVQMTSTGTGIRHSEYAGNNEDVHFLQIWAKPSEYGLTPGYYTRHFTDEEKRDAIVPIVAPIGNEGVTDEREGSGPAPIHAGLSAYSSILTPSKAVAQILPHGTRRAFVHLITSEYRAPGQKPASDAAELFIAGGEARTVLKEGDGAYIDVEKGGQVELSFRSEGSRDAEFILFTMST